MSPHAILKSISRMFKFNDIIVMYMAIDYHAFRIIGNDHISLTKFWKTNHFVTFGIIYISVNLRHSIWHYWFNKWLNQSQTSQITILEVCAVEII